MTAALPRVARTGGLRSPRLIAPSLRLASCVRAFIARDPIGDPGAQTQRTSRFPANPACSLTWFLDGHLRWIRHADDPPLAVGAESVFFAGPQTMPTETCTSGDPRVFMCLLFPDALRAMSGLQPSRWRNRLAPLGDALDASWQAMADAVAGADDDDARVAIVETFLEPRWQQARPAGLGASGRFADWLHALQLRAFRPGSGHSVRQGERRIKDWSGQSARELRGFGKAEQALVQARAQTRPDWADVALRHGYADQSHLNRITRRLSGLSPARLHRAVEDDDRYWIYRLWR